jgi:radical SAM protein with 4Fe4S-binding SPASM domain
MWYMVLNIRLLFRFLLAGKMTIKKIWNYVNNYLHRMLQTETAGFLPSIINFETTNFCNLRCVGCRDNIDHLGKFMNTDQQKILLGTMPVEMFKRVIDETSRHLLLAVLYVGGEPLMHKHIAEMVQYASTKRVATLLSTNGMLLTERNIAALLDSKLDFLKIAVSGFTQDVYATYHRGGDIEKIKGNLRNLVGMKKTSHSPLLIMIDYILFEHNQQEVAVAQHFAAELGIIFNVRKGRISENADIKPVKGKELRHHRGICDWLWFIAVVHWDGRIFPCCEFSMYSNIRDLGNAQDKLTQLWNGEQYRQFRNIFITGAEDKKSFLCRTCHYKGISFQG